MLCGKEFDEIDPKAVKKLIANNIKAKKDEVAKALSLFVGEQSYACDDESDAVAVGVAWLLVQDMIDDPWPTE